MIYARVVCGGGKCMEISTEIRVESIEDRLPFIRIYCGKDKLGSFLRVDLGSLNDPVVKKNLYKLEMLRHNEISHMLKPIVGVVNNRSIIRYDITGVVNLTSMAKMVKLNSHIVDSILTSASETRDKLGDFLLSDEEISLDPSCVFFDLETKKAKFIYIPGYRRKYYEQIKCLLEFMIVNYDTNDESGLLRLHRACSGINNN